MTGICLNDVDRRGIIRKMAAYLNIKCFFNLRKMCVDIYDSKIVLRIKFKETKYCDIKCQTRANGTKEDDFHLGDFSKEIS